MRLENIRRSVESIELDEKEDRKGVPVQVSFHQLSARLDFVPSTRFAGLKDLIQGLFPAQDGKVIEIECQVGQKENKIILSDHELNDVLEARHKSLQQGGRKGEEALHLRIHLRDQPGLSQPERVKLFLLGFFREFLGAALFSINLSALTDSAERSPKETNFGLNLCMGLLISVTTMMQIQLVLNRSKRTNVPSIHEKVGESVKCCLCPRSWSKPSFLLGLAAFSHVVFQTLITVNPNDKAYTPIVCAIEDSGLAFAILVGVTSSVAFLLEFMHRLWNWRKDAELYNTICIRLLLTIIMIVDICAIVTGVLSYIIFLLATDSQDEAVSVSRVCIIAIHSTEIFLMIFYLRDTTSSGDIGDWWLNLAVAVTAFLTAWAYIFSYATPRDVSPVLIAPHGICMAVLIALLMISLKRRPWKDAAGNGEYDIYSYCYLCFLFSASIAAHSIHAERARREEYTQFEGDTLKTIFADNVLECVTTFVAFSIALMKMKWGLGNEQDLISVGKIAAACVAILWINSLLEEISHLHHAYSTCEDESMTVQSQSSGSTVIISEGGNESTPHGGNNSNLLYFELALFGFFTEFCLFCMEILLGAGL